MSPNHGDGKGDGDDDGSWKVGMQVSDTILQGVDKFEFIMFVNWETIILHNDTIIFTK